MMSNLEHQNRPKEFAITVPIRTYLKLALAIILTIIFLAALKKSAHALILLLVALFVALALNAPVNWLSHRLPGKSKGSRALATTLSYLVIIIVLGAFLASVMPPLIHQTEKLVKEAPQIVQQAKTQQGAIGHFVRKHHLEHQVSTLSDQLSARLSHFGGNALASFGSVLSSVFSVGVVLVLAFMMLVEGPRWVKFAKIVIPKKNHLLAARMANDMYRVVKGYVNGQVILAAIASAFIFPAVLILHIPYPAALVFIIFICGLIPMVGHTIGGIIVTLVALFHSVETAIIILAYYLIYQQIENYGIAPRIQANTTRMSPLLVLASILIGVSFGGLVGGLFAIPVAGCLRIAFLEFLRTRGNISNEQFAQAVHETKPNPD